MFQGGSYLDLHKMLGVKSGAEVLYVGDHVYSDLLRGKKGANWRTMLVIPELESELDTLQQCGTNMTELRVLRQQRDALDDQIQRLEWKKTFGSGSSSSSSNNINSSSISSIDDSDDDDSDDDVNGGGGASSSSAAAAIEELLNNLREQRDAVRARHRGLLQSHHEAFHPVWGQLFKTGYQNSRYAHQVERFACLYSSHVSNLVFHSPLRSFRGRIDSMAHEDAPLRGSLITSSSGLVSSDGDGDELI